MNWQNWFGGVQTALSAAGLNAGLITDLTLLMTAVLTAAFFITMIAVAIAWFNRGSGTWIIWTGGLVFPVVTLIAMSAAATITSRALIDIGEPDAIVIEVTGHQFWWDVRYPEQGDAPFVRTANEIHLPAGVPVTIALTTDDVIHSFWMPSIAGKLDMIPGRTNELDVQAERPGIYRGQCAEFCGLQHPRMAFDVVVHTPENFARWRRGLALGAEDPVTPQERRGQEVFVENGCPACHRIADVAEDGLVGPDLTNIGARRTIGAGMWPNNRGTLAGWIANVDEMKPGAEMPAYDRLSGRDLRALAAYLEGLQ